MPMIRVTHTEGAIADGRADWVVGRLLDVFVGNHVASACAAQLERVTVVTLHPVPRDRLYVGREPCGRNRYQVEFVVPEGSVEGASRDAVVRGVTEVLLAQEGTPYGEAEAHRVWVVFRDVPEGRWAVGGVVLTVKAILRHLVKERRADRAAAGTATAGT